MDSCLSDAKIIKALKRCSSEAVCLGCPLDKTEDCSGNLMKMAAQRIDALSKERKATKKDGEYVQQLLDRINELHKEILQYEAERDWPDERGENIWR